MIFSKKFCFEIFVGHNWPKKDPKWSFMRNECMELFCCLDEVTVT